MKLQDSLKGIINEIAAIDDIVNAIKNPENIPDLIWGIIIY